MESALQRGENACAKCFAVALICLLLCVVINFGGCTGDRTTTTDVTADSRYWGGYKPNTQLVVQRDIFVLVIRDWPGFLCQPNEVPGISSATQQATRLPSTDAYKKGIADAPFVVGVLGKNSRIRVTAIRFFNSTTFYQLQIFAEVSDGDFKGKQIRIDTISKVAAGGGIALWPDPEWLKPVSTDSQPALPTKD
jgi:hypothetical protein